MPAPPPAEAPTPTALRWEPRRLTLLRASLAVPPADADTPDVNRALEALVEKVQSFGGRVEELGRTALVAIFGLEPVEDAPRRAAHAAMTIQKMGERVRRANPDRPAVTVALHTGQFTVGLAGSVAQIDLDAKREGWAVLAALTAAAEADSVLLSGATAALIERRFEVTPVGAVAGVPGIAHRLAGLERPTEARRLVPFVGRRGDLDLLQSRLASAMHGHGQVVGIAGETGIGKSRLLLEFRQSLAGRPVTYLEGHCYSYGMTTPYLPLLRMLRQNCRIAEADAPAVIVEKVRRAVAAVRMDPDEAAAYLLHLLGMKEGTERLQGLSPEAVKARMFEVMWQLSLQGSRGRPIVFAVEDVHWIDSASRAYLDSLVESLAGAAIMLVATYRPGYRPQWMEKSYATQIALQPLGPDESLSVVRAILKRDDVPEAFAQAVLAKAEGNPFFLEELARALADQGGAAPVAVPDTIQDVLLARIEGLAEPPRQLLRTAAILGREVSLRLLRQTWSGVDAVEPLLRELVRLEFLYDRPAGDEPVYVFKHVLTRDVARESLPAARRQALHAAAGQAYERLYGDRLDEVCDSLAYHFTKGKIADKAVLYLSRLADKAARSHAHVEAVTALREALGQLERLPLAERVERGLALILRQAHSLSFLGRFPETLDLLQQEDAARRVAPDPATAGPYHFWLGHTYSYLGDHARATESAQRAFEVAARAGDEATMGKACVVLAQENYWGGQPLHGIARGRRAVELLIRADERWWLGLAHWIVGINYI
ncbi:MAG: ATP-binding protein, partial [Candidatus Rokuibacteriota bacterium]